MTYQFEGERIRDGRTYRWFEGQRRRDAAVALATGTDHAEVGGVSLCQRQRSPALKHVTADAACLCGPFAATLTNTKSIMSFEKEVLFV